MIHSYIQYYCLVWTVFSYKLATSLWTQPSLNIAVLSSLVFEKFVNNCRERQQLMKSITGCCVILSSFYVCVSTECDHTEPSLLANISSINHSQPAA